MSVAERLLGVRARIADAAKRSGRDPSAVSLLAVSKKQPKARVLEAYAAGQRELGENYVQALASRRAELPADVRLHLIGHLQSNKAKVAALAADVIHTIDSERIAAALAKAAERPIPVLLEVNIAAEAQKAGVLPDASEPLCVAVRHFSQLSLAGLMCIPPEGEGRRWFAALRDLRDELRAKTGLPLDALSMGMSDDFEDAILEGATIVRVGTAIFGPREV